MALAASMRSMRRLEGIGEPERRQLVRSWEKTSLKICTPVEVENWERPRRLRSEVAPSMWCFQPSIEALLNS